MAESTSVTSASECTTSIASVLTGEESRGEDELTSGAVEGGRKGFRRAKAVVGGKARGWNETGAIVRI